MIDVLQNIQIEDSIILTAPPGWGKTYKLLEAIKTSKRKVVFIFPLRALCDEVYLKSIEFKIPVINLRSVKDYELVLEKNYDLIVTTPELVKFSDSLLEYVFILDEFHLFYYWGDSFRERMQEIYMEITSFSVPVIFLTATLGDKLKDRLVNELRLNYENIYQINMGNQLLKNYPNKIYLYPKYLQSWIKDDYKYSNKRGTSLIFCKYRQEVKKVTNELRSMGYCVLSCVGGEAQGFVNILNTKDKIDFIVATSVISHGVNLPNIQNLYFTYKVENLDFYIQMVGRGGRSGEVFNIHVQNLNYFKGLDLFIGFCRIFLKRLSNKVQSLLYYAYAC
jgi:superfamily II DNA or RNA helicase